MEKRCSRCKQTKQRVDFYRDRTTKDTYSNVCKDCDREKQRLRAIKNVGKELKAREPAKIKARALINNGLKSGSIVRQECFLCDEAESEAHHLNYDFPSKVIWLCRSHHLELHRGW